MSLVTGIGGVFFKSRNPPDLARWYREVLDMPTDPGSSSWAFPWRDVSGEPGYTVWGVFRSSTSYFGSSGQIFMINLRVSDLDAALARLRAAGAQVDDRVETTGEGRFGWFYDPDGRRVELWEPAPIK
jgi:predicted enzyme related to lactoylglutathione lyase